jgi:MYXO-CTERM domain-containing protein
MPFCIDVSGTRRCAGCRDFSDCNTAKPACDPVNLVCVECTDVDVGACIPSEKGGRCLSSLTCGCDGDADCGGGKRCDTTTHLCFLPPDMSLPVDMSVPDLAMADQSASVDMDPGHLAGGGGCSCDVGGAGSPGGTLVMLLVWVLARSRRRRCNGGSSARARTPG